MKLTEAEWFASNAKVVEALCRLNRQLFVARIINRGNELLRHIEAALQREGE